MREIELMQRARLGDLSAFNQLVADHQAIAFNLAFRLLGDRQNAEAAVQQGILLLFQRLDEIEGDTFLYFLLRAIVHTCQAWQQNNIGNTEIETDQVQPGLNQLPFEQRLVVLLADICGLSMQEIRIVMDVPQDVIKPMIGRARISLRDLWFGERASLTFEQALLHTVCRRG